MADTTLKQFAEVFDKTSQEMYILMLSDKEAFQDVLDKSDAKNTDAVRLDIQSMSQLETMYYDKAESAEAPILEVANVLGCTEADIDKVIASGGDEFKRITRFVKAENIRYIKFKCIGQIMTGLKDLLVKQEIPESKTAAPEKKTGRKKTDSVKKTIKTEIPEKKTEPDQDVPVKNDEKKVEPVKKKKKRKYAVSKSYLKEHGYVASGDMKAMRMFLLDNGDFKAEDVALMSDQDVAKQIESDYFVLSAADKTIVVKRSGLETILDDISVIDNL